MSTSYRPTTDGLPPKLHSGHAHRWPLLPTFSITGAKQGKASRNIVLLLDGTGNQFSCKNTNIIKLMSVLQADEDQLLYYSSGIGTILPESASTWGEMKQAAAELVDKVFAWSFEDFVCDAYKFLMDYYQTGDRVFIFGFSRGAYTARTLAAMVQRVGLLPPGNHNQIKLAYEVYMSPRMVQKRGHLEAAKVEDISTQYRRIFGISRPVCIHFVGVWDTVSSLGGIRLPSEFSIFRLPIPHFKDDTPPSCGFSPLMLGLPYAAGVRSANFFRHALALDERRARYTPEFRRLEPGEERVEADEVMHTAQECAEAVETIQTHPNSPLEASAMTMLEMNMLQAHPAVAYAGDECGDKDNIKVLRKNVECWFMGCHSDVGGGNDPNSQDDSLADIPFRWMLREAEQCGVKLDAIGVVLQPALSVLPVQESKLIPAELLGLLQEQLFGEIIEHKKDQKVHELVREHLKPHVLHDIVKIAAAHDSAMDPKGRAGEPITGDLKQLPHNSLTLMWWPVELMYLQQREYYDDDNKVRDVWKFNLGYGRQMIKGQCVHRSVHKRLRYDHPIGDEDGKGHDGPKYDGPKAYLPKTWDTTWDALRRGEGPAVWED